MGAAEEHERRLKRTLMCQLEKLRQLGIVMRIYAYSCRNSANEWPRPFLA
ncbi:hypothetical protein Dsin_002697 [Dipteronia sinensis]|uniref:Uncharacterized protein n=1 Tax=Dipteronia sinensis TaxID=43782 RepID=A0AAE0B687_9ROSI|nr:hypothetical protein Dsin_002697 [Dipteronia sinensis]